MLQESIEEMRNTLPKLNQILVTTRATVIRLEQEKEELERKEKQLVNSIKAALTEGSPESRRIAEVAFEWARRRRCAPGAGSRRG